MASDILVKNINLTVILKEPGERAQGDSEVFFRQNRTFVMMVVGGYAKFEVSWVIADRLAQAMKRIHQQYPDRVMMIVVDGRTVLEIPPRFVLQVHEALVACVRKAEEIEKHDQ